MAPFLSIIIPVHNSEKYLERCVDSIISQTFSDYELILIDDGSCDMSWNICSNYSILDKRVRSIKLPVNKGVSAARNAGLDNATGKWVYFCDSDDYLNEDSLEILTNYAKDGIDLILAGYTRITTEQQFLYSLPDSRAFDRTQALERYFETGKTRIQGFLWNRLFRREVIQKNMIRFNESVFYKEDGLFIVRYMCYMKDDVFYVPDAVYNYVIHPDSAMGIVVHVVTDKFLTNLDARILSLDEIRKHVGVERVIQKAEESVFNFEFWIFAIMRENHHFEYMTLFRIIRKTIKSIGLTSYIHYMSRAIMSHIRHNI